MQCHYGDVPGDGSWPPMPLPRRRRTYTTPGWIERGVQVAIAWTAVAFYGGLVLIWVLFLFLFAAKPSLAHADADWIARGGFRNAMGELCCGVRDCEPIPASRVTVTPWGYRVGTDIALSGNRPMTMHETIPFHEATPTPPEIGGYWLCKWGGWRKCFFAPAGLT